MIKFNLEMKFSRIIFCALILLYPISLSASTTIHEEYQSRLEMVKAWADTVKSNNFFVSAAKIKFGRNKKDGMERFASQLQRLEKSPSGMFDIYSLMISYLAVEDLLPENLKQQVREAMRTANFYRGDTENHLTMYYTGLYLAAQAFPDLPAKQWYTGKSSAQNMQEALGWLNFWMETTTTIGQGEFDSPTYMPVFIAPMLGLYSFAKDPVIKQNAKIMLYWLIADFAVEHLYGMYVGAHSREYPERLINKDHPATGMNAWAWLLFGQRAPTFNATLIPAALTDFVLPEILYHIGTDRQQPYVHTETKRVRNIIRLGDTRNPPVYKYTYMTKDFALGSMMGGQILQPIQQHTWDLSFVTKSPYASIFTVHPFVGKEDLGKFFPEEMKFSLDEVVNFHTYYGSEDKWSASSPFEQTFQHKNAIIVLYNIPKATRFAHIDGFFPKDLDERVEDPSGWIFCKGGNTYIAFFPLQPYQWIEEDEGYRLRSYELKNGCVMEVAQVGEYNSFAEFQQQIRCNTLAHDTFKRTLTVSYTTSAGDVMTFTYDGPRKLNGKKIDFADDNLFRGPFLNAEVNSRKLAIEYKNKGMVLDMATEEKGLILPEYICKKINRDLNISGKMDDPLWKSAHAVELADAITGESGRLSTSVRALYNEKYLYVGFRCQDDYIWGTCTRRDESIWNEECVEVFLDPAQCGHQYYEIDVSPKNIVFDTCMLNGRSTAKPNAKFVGLPAFNLIDLTTRTDVNGEMDKVGKGQGWSAELVIPIEELFGAPNIPPQPGDVWRANFYRIDSPQKGQQELYAWSRTERPTFHLPWRFGYLKFGE